MRQRSLSSRWWPLLVGVLALLLPVDQLALAQQVPEIPFDADLDFLKLPPDMYFGEVSGVAVNSKGTSSSSRAATRRARLRRRRGAAARVRQDGKFIREIGKDLYAWSFAHAVRVDKDDNIWAVDKGSDMIIKFNPARARGRWCSGARRKRRTRRPGRVKHPKPPLPARRRPVPPADRRRLGPGGQHLHQRRLHQLARRQVRQERRLGQVVGRPRRPSRASSTRRTASRPTRRATSTSPTAATAASRCSISDGKFLRVITIDVPFDHDAQPAIGNQPDPNAKAGTLLAGRAVGAVHHAGPEPGPVHRRRVSGPHLQADARRQGARRARRSRASSRSSSAGSTRSPARRRTSSTSPSCSTGGCRS